MTIGEWSENLQYLLELQKQRNQKRIELVQRGKKNLEPPYFQISYLYHFLFVLNNLKIYRSAIWRFIKPFWSAKTIEWHSKILSSKIQIGHMCQPISCMWASLLGKNISYSFFHWFEWFFLHWMCHLKLYKTIWEVQK
jgi:hypothetical protein